MQVIVFFLISSLSVFLCNLMAYIWKSWRTVQCIWPFIFYKQWFKSNGCPSGTHFLSILLPNGYSILDFLLLSFLISKNWKRLNFIIFFTIIKETYYMKFIIIFISHEVMKFVVCSIVVLSYWLYFPICREYQEHIVRLPLWRHFPNVRLSHVKRLKKHLRFE